MYHEFGPTRLCFEYPSDPPRLEIYQQCLVNAIGEITLDKLKAMAFGARGLAMDAASNKIILISRTASVSRSRCVVGLIYESMAQRMLQKRIELELAPMGPPRVTSGTPAISPWLTLAWEPCKP